MNDPAIPIGCVASKKLDSPTESIAERTAQATPTSFSDSPVPRFLPERSAPQSRTIGDYRLLKKLGEGGMGQVWLAEQIAPLQRQVAVKLIKAGMYDDTTLHRFQSERQSLAVMEHPSIAKVFDAGISSEDQPFLVMEYVPGLPITDYCDQKKLRICERLKLFIKVCEGVQHAHQKAIIHRDLKPANILVVEIDGEPQPRIIDFGLAKKQKRHDLDETTFTQIGGWAGTPGYMSPEQIDPNVGDIDTRTDVYSLGAVLYVLLTGSLPFDPKEWQNRPLDYVLRQLREGDPPRPSARIAMENSSSISTAEMRDTKPKQLAKQLRGDLDCITMKALEKERARRYGMPSELAADLGRCSHNEPVLARPAGVGYRTQKYVRRHRMAVAVAACIVLLLAGFAVVQAEELQRITRERDRANRITDFMIGMFKVSDPSEAKGKSITAREILDKASGEIDAGLSKDPELQADMEQTMGTVYQSLGLYNHSETLLHRAMTIRQHALGDDNVETAASKYMLGTTLGNEGHYLEAETLLRGAVDVQQRRLGPQAPVTLKSMAQLGWFLGRQGRFGEAEAVLGKVLDVQRRALGPEHPDTLYSMDDFGIILEEDGKYQAAESLQRQALDSDMHVVGAEDPKTLGAMNDLVITLARQGKLAEAENIESKTIELQKHAMGSEHPNTLVSMNNLSAILILEHHYQQAEKLIRDTLDVQRRVQGPDSPDTVRSMSNLAEVLADENRLSGAELLDRETLEIRRRVLGADNPDTLRSMETLANTLAREGKYQDSSVLLRRSVSVDARIFGPDHPQTAQAKYDLACVMTHQGKFNEAFSLLKEALQTGLSSRVAMGIDKDPDLSALHGNPRFDALVILSKRGNRVEGRN